MKIKKIEKDSCGRYDLAELPEKVNEIIELLNNSIITDDPGTIYGWVTDSLPTERLTSVTCDRVTPSTNETTCEITAEHVLNMIEGDALYAGVKCPKCGAKYFEVGPSYCTLVNYPTIIKDGVNINPDRNKCVTTYTCCECGHRWEQ